MISTNTEGENTFAVKETLHSNTSATLALDSPSISPLNGESSNTTSFKSLQKSRPSPLPCVRDNVFNVASCAGAICSSLMNTSTSTSLPQGGSAASEALKNFRDAVLDLANATGMDLGSCVVSKLKLNALKYPVKLCRGRAGKYTEYTEVTGIDGSVESQQKEEHKEQAEVTPERGAKETPDSRKRKAAGEDETNTTPSGSLPPSELPVQDIIKMVNTFVQERDWDQFHTPRNIALALLGEAGELCEIFQWLGDEADGKVDVKGKWEKKERTHLGQELADVTIYSIRLATLQGIPYV